MKRLGTFVALSVVLSVVGAACAGQGAASSTPTAAAPSTVTASPTPASESRPGGIEGAVTDLAGSPVAGLRVGIVGGTAAFPEIAPETDEEGHYQIGGVAPGTFRVAVQDRDGQRVGLESVVVKSGETASLNFSVSLGAPSEEQPAAEASPVSTRTTTKEPTEGLCLPEKPLAVSVGDMWTISGPVKVPTGFQGELHEDAAEMSSTFVVEAIESTQYVAGRGAAPIENRSVELRVTNITLDADGMVLTTEASSGTWAPASVVNLGPVLTPDWECHETAWLAAWSETGEASVGERTLSSGVTAVVFTVRQPFVISAQGIDATLERHHGYDKLTGRVVLQETHAAGTMNGRPFNMDMLQELVPGGSTTAPTGTGLESCQKYLDLLVAFDEGTTEERAVVTSYQCLATYVDSTAQYPSRSPSLVVPHGVPLSLRMAAEQQPVTLDVRLYSGAGISGSFGKWPEELSTGIKSVDSLQPTPSLTFQYLPQQPAGEYSLVVRATWDGPIDVFFALSLRLE